MPGANFSFEPADIVSRVMSLGADTPIEVATSRAFAEKIKGNRGVYYKERIWGDSTELTLAR